MFYNTSSLKNVYVENMPSLNGGNNTNMWYSSKINNFTVWDYETKGSPLQ